MAATQTDTFPTHVAEDANPSAPSPQVITLQQQLVASESEARDSGALLELLTKLQSADSLSKACCLLVNDLRAYLNCGTLAVTMRRGTRGNSSLRSISSMAEFDSHSELVRQFEAACDEAVLGDRSTIWPPLDDSQRHATMALKTLCAQTGATSAICSLLRNSDGNIVGSWLILNIDPEDDQRTHNLAHAFAPPVANCLAALERQHRNVVVRLVHFIGLHGRTRVGWIVAVLLGLAVAAMFVPATHKVKCDCRLEPVTRRFVAAPFEGTLEEALVEPGDVVAKGALLARLDGREIRWKQAELVAERARAAKKRDAELATGKFGAAQISKLEMQRTDLQIQLLEHRADNLDIRSPIAGVITSGDLQRAQGAPLTLGQSLFEVAPLDAMVVEIAIPQDDICFVKKTLSVDVQLDSLSGDTWQLTIDRVQPRAEIRDQQSVFIGTALLENQDGRLRPGMEGKARVLCPKRPVGWLLFHKPWEALRMWSGW
ncbi:MAG TPA: efflux RND transporter periplasmic adaptor subunit [Pirellulaceae bacterium]|jgi:multidrug resistance efflux pump|nr:efflux RND transporter periplasmic adaptor subunit [Pirellulaceae bacterium]